MWKGSPIQYLNSEIVTPICISLRIPFFKIISIFFIMKILKNFRKLKKGRQFPFKNVDKIKENS